MASRKDKYLGCMYGLAIGDALGFPVEFMTLDEIKLRFGEKGVKDFESIRKSKGMYSDDTQMSLATARGLIKSKSTDFQKIMPYIVREYIEWANSEENNRAPGQTCMDGIRKLEEGVHWKESGDTWSKGCGAAMRTAPIGLYLSDNTKKLKDTAYAVSVCTHGNPTGIAAGIGTAFLTASALKDEDPRKMYQQLVGLNLDPDFTRKIEQVQEVLRYEDHNKAIKELGEGWVGEESVAVALYCFLKNPKDFRKAVLMATNTSGDSDSLACITGAISGAYNGIGAIPTEWVRDIENSGLIKTTAELLYESFEDRLNERQRKVYLFATPLTDQLFGIRPTETAPNLVKTQTDQRYILEKGVRINKNDTPDIKQVLTLDINGEDLVAKTTPVDSPKPTDYTPTNRDSAEKETRDHLSKKDDKAIVGNSEKTIKIKQKLEQIAGESDLDREVILIDGIGYNDQLTWGK